MANNAMYNKVFETIKNRIDQGIYSVGELLPTEQELGEEFKVSRTTIRRAIELLSRDNYLYAKQGFGTMVLDYKTKQSLNAITSISETLRNKGMNVRSKTIHVDTIEATPSLADKLNVKPGALIARVQRIQLADEKPIAIMQNYLIADSVPDLQRYAKTNMSLYLYIEKEYNISIEKTNDQITARSSTFAEAEMLQIPVGAALIIFNRICYQQDKAVCVDYARIVGDRYEFELTLSGREIYGVK